MSTSIPAHFVDLVDDAAIFPPGNADLAEAVAAWDARSGAPEADLVGAFVITDHRLGELDRLLTGPMPITVVLAQGAGAIAPVAGIVARSQKLTLAGLEVALRDLDGLAENARRVVAAVEAARAEGVLDERVPVYVELPQERPSRGWLAAADEVAMADLRLKFRTGGLDESMFPGTQTLLSWLDAALDRETPFKCTAGLHHAVRAPDPETGFVHHGFLNVLLATRRLLDGEDALSALTEANADALVEALPEGEALLRTRKWFTSFGSCSITDPLDDLHALGLLEVS